MAQVNINVGGGKFLHRGWLNLDGRAGFTLSPTCTFPLDSADTVYSSHCLEHLDDATVDRVLSEARRVGKTLVLKLPNFDQVIERRIAWDENYFDKWGMSKLYRMWDVVDVDRKASMVFCGYWNKEYGHEFGGRRPDAEGAYHGPVELDSYDFLVENHTPHEIAAILKSKAPAGVQFNHQNAWSLAELVALVGKHGWRVESVNDEEICKMPIPTIEDMRDISMYLKAV